MQSRQTDKDSNPDRLNPPFKYRPDVDGLRAIAVVMVVIYHAGLGFPGGYVGVDVFFEVVPLEPLVR